jgi:hypothetical protein
MNQQEKEQLAKRVHEMHLRLGALKKNISQCLTAMDSLADKQEKATADKLRYAWVQTALDSPIADVLEQLPSDNMIGFVGAFAALNLAYSSINAYATAWKQDCVSEALGNKNDVVQ